MYKIKLVGNIATSGSMKTITAKRGETINLPANKYKRAGFKFMGWSTERNDVINMKRYQLGKVKYKNRAEVRNLGKDGETVKLYACWKGVGIEAAASWAKLLAKDNSFAYGADNHKDWYHGRDRAHQIGCYFCGTTITGPKKAKKGSRWEKTYGCNPLVMAALVHGMGLFKKCSAGSVRAAYWAGLRVDGKPIFKIIGKNLKYSELKPGDLLCSDRHIKMFTGKSKMPGLYLVTHAAGEGWGSKSIRTDRVHGRTGKNYTVVRFIG